MFKLYGKCVINNYILLFFYGSMKIVVVTLIMLIRIHCKWCISNHYEWLLLIKIIITNSTVVSFGSEDLNRHCVQITSTKSKSIAFIIWSQRIFPFIDSYSNLPLPKNIFIYREPFIKFEFTFENIIKITS